MQLSQQLEAYQKQAVATQDLASVAAIFAKVIPADFILDESFNCNTNNFPVGLDLDPGLDLMLERLHRVVASHKDKVLEVADCLSVAPSCFWGLTD